MPPVQISKLSASGELRWRDLDSLIECIGRCLAFPTRLFHLDLSEVLFCDPASLVILAASMAHLHGLGCHRVGTIRPAKGDVDRYLDRMGFYSFLEGHPNVDIQGLSSTGKFLEIAQLKNVEDCEVASEKVAQVFQYNFGMTDQETRMVTFVLAEMLANIFDHAQSHIGGLFCCQTYPIKKLVRIGIADLGIGIERSLRENPANLERLKEASPIEIAVQKKVTGRPAKYGGYGLFLASKIIEANQGVFAIRSRRHDWQQVHGVTRQSQGLDWPGTALNLIFRTNKPIVLSQLLNRLTEEHNLDDVI